jgi:hypothetical protein
MITSADWLFIFTVLCASITVLIIVNFFAQKGYRDRWNEKQALRPNKNITQNCHIKFTKADLWKTCRKCDPCNLKPAQCGVQPRQCCGCGSGSQRSK